MRISALLGTPVARGQLEQRIVRKAVPETPQRPESADAWQPLSRRPLSFGKAETVQDAASSRSRAEPGYQRWPYGASPGKDGRTRVKLWAPRAQSVELLRMKRLSPEEAAQLKSYHKALQKRALIRGQIRALEWIQNARPDVSGFLTRLRDQDLPQAEKEVSHLETQEGHRYHHPTSRIEQRVPMKTDGHGNFFVATNLLKTSRIQTQGPLGKGVVQPGSLYMFHLKYDKPENSPTGHLDAYIPDTVNSRFQPEGVHGPSEVIHPAFRWSPKATQFWNSPKDFRDLVTYRAHVGTFSPNGTYAGMAKRVQYLKWLGVDALELFPVNETPGEWNLGYDPINLHAPKHTYGRPEALKQLVELCHENGLMVFFDVVYNHMGPEGNYRHFLDARYRDPHGNQQWGDQHHFEYYNPHYTPESLHQNRLTRHRIRFPDNGRFVNHYANPALDHVVRNGLMLLHEFHADGLRVDMACRMPDWATRVMTETWHQQRPGKLYLKFEDDREENRVSLPPAVEGLGANSRYVYALAHSLTRAFKHGQDEGRPEAVAHLTYLIRNKFANPRESLHNSEAAAIFADGHDLTANEGGGFTLHQALTPAQSRAAVALLLTIPGHPVLFQGFAEGRKGQFRFFADHSDETVIAHTLAGRGEHARPDHSMTEEAFQVSRFNAAPREMRLARMTKDLLTLRKQNPAMRQNRRYAPDGKELFTVWDDYHRSSVVAMHRMNQWPHPDNETFILANLSGVDHPHFQVHFPQGEWRQIFSTETKGYGGDQKSNAPHVSFHHGEGIKLPAWSVLIFKRQPAPSLLDRLTPSPN